VPAAEQRYLEEHWPILSRLREVLRTEPNVRLAVLFGSTARGQDGPDSDVDIVVELRDPDHFRLIELEDRLGNRIGRRVDLIRMSDAADEPGLMSEVLIDGRVVIDRERRWPDVARQRGRYAERAERDGVARTRSALERARDVALG